VFKTEGTDVAGFSEAVRRRGNLIFAADDEVFAAFNLEKMRTVYNSDATGRAYAAALELIAKGLGAEPVSVIGVGKVGSAAVDYLTRKGAHIHVFDFNRAKVDYIRAAHSRLVTPCDSVEECFKRARLILLAAPARNIVHENMIREDTVVSAPAIPLGLTKDALKKISWKNLIHDPLELGVATMAVEIVKP
jgi:pyrrolysine biosynthesis protein PylD